MKTENLMTGTALILSILLAEIFSDLTGLWLFYTWLLSINIISFFIYGVDKYLSIANRYSFSNNSLLLFAVLGGSLGGIIGVHLFKHKTLIDTFLSYLYFILAVQALISYFTWKWI